MLQILNFRMRRAFWENFGENCRRERQKIVPSRSRKTRMKPSKTGKPLPKSQLDFEFFLLHGTWWKIEGISPLCQKIRTIEITLKISSRSQITRLHIRGTLTIPRLAVVEFMSGDRATAIARKSSKHLDLLRTYAQDCHEGAMNITY